MTYVCTLTIRVIFGNILTLFFVFIWNPDDLIHEILCTIDSFFILRSNFFFSMIRIQELKMMPIDQKKISDITLIRETGWSLIISFDFFLNILSFRRIIILFAINLLNIEWSIIKLNKGCKEIPQQNFRNRLHFHDLCCLYMTYATNWQWWLQISNFFIEYERKKRTMNFMRWSYKPYV